MDFQLDNLEKKNPAKKKERVRIFFGKELESLQPIADTEGQLQTEDEDGNPINIPSTIPRMKIIDKRRKRKIQENEEESSTEYLPTDRKGILAKLNLQDVVEELKTQSQGRVLTESDLTALINKKGVKFAEQQQQQEEYESLSEVLSNAKKDANEDEEDSMKQAEEDLNKDVKVLEEGDNELQEEPKVKIIKAVKITPKAKKVLDEAVGKIDLKTVKIGEKIVASRLPQKKRYAVRVSDYYMNNRKLYIQNLAQMFKPYRDEIMQKTDKITCDSLREIKVDFDLLTHQKVVRDYLNLFTPYRGLLLYHSLGSGKSCSSIAIAEGMKSQKKIVLMTPASLKMNFFNELKKCGDPLYKKNQFWEFVSIEGKRDLIPVLAQTLGLTQKYIRENKGAWLTDISKPSNAAQLSSADQESLNAQIDTMIRAKYYDINYNGMNKKKLREMTKNGSINPFDHSVVVIDEAHNFVSRICNKLKDSASISYKLYNYLMDATDVRVVLVSGTPIINYPNEIGVLFNILRGYIKTWIFNLQSTTTKKINLEFILDLFEKNGFNTFDYVQYSGNMLTITRNPYGFINNYRRRGSFGGSKTKTKKQTKQKREPIKEVKKESKKRTRKNKSNNDDEIYEIKDGVLIRKPLKEIPLTYEETSEYGHEVEEDVHKGGANELEDYSGVRLDDTGNISDDDFQREIIRILAKQGIRAIMQESEENKLTKTKAKAKTKGLKDTGEEDVPVSTFIPPTKYKCLPDNSKDFLDTFVDINGTMTNTDMFKRRILGLASYYRSSQEQLMPQFVMTDHNEPYYKIIIDMSEFQFGYYYKIRKDELDKDKKRKRKKKAPATNVKDIIEDKVSSSYRIFSRSACNFAFPDEYPRPMPDKKILTEDDFNAVTKEMRTKRDDYIEDDENVEEVETLDDDEEGEGDDPTPTYLKRIEDTLEKLRYDPLHPRPQEFLTLEGLEKYSPKFLRILENIQDEENEGLHMLYSQFRTIEGIGLFQLVLEAAGFAQMKIRKVGDSWELDEQPEDFDKPKFVLYTGTETKAEKEVILNIYNSTWDFIPPEMAAKLRQRHANNHRGEIVKLLMITSSGAEGINLRNTRFVHIMEPYWNNVRIEQVVGRARRICSHEDLPEEMRTVKVFMYLMQFTEKQRKDDKHIQLMINDISRIDPAKAITTDESLLETAQIKQRLNMQILKAVKESAMDCNVYIGKNNEENLVCYGYGKVNSNQFGTYPTLEMDKAEKVEQYAVKTKLVTRKITDQKTGIDYALNPKTGDVYDLDNLDVVIGRLVKYDTRDKRGLKKTEFNIEFLKA
uniref:Helicase ATP-binding domain-containing protein n=1 Tax=viral metagenome TaxID=1070528 RepID=A0A6C0I008_9ZZZZ